MTIGNTDPQFMISKPELMDCVWSPLYKCDIKI